MGKTIRRIFTRRSRRIKPKDVDILILDMQDRLLFRMDLETLAVSASMVWYRDILEVMSPVKVKLVPHDT